VGCLFQDDYAGAWGGGLYCQDSNGVLLDCTFHANGASDGGAIACDEGCDTRLTGCRFLGNAAHDSGGAVFAAGRDLSIANTLFSGNLAFANGGAFALTRGTAALTNCTFNRNLAEGKQSGQTLSVAQASARLTNCILWGPASDTQKQIALIGTAETKAELTVSYCDVSGGASSVLRQGTTAFTWAAGNIDADPRFQDAAGADKIAGTPDDDLRLRSGSPCVDAGDNTAVPVDADDLDYDNDRLERLPLDIDARPRFVDHPATVNTGIADAPRYPQIVDLGACESPAQ